MLLINKFLVCGNLCSIDNFPFPVPFFYATKDCFFLTSLKYCESTVIIGIVYI